MTVSTRSRPSTAGPSRFSANNNHAAKKQTVLDKPIFWGLTSRRPVSMVLRWPRIGTTDYFRPGGAESAPPPGPLNGGGAESAPPWSPPGGAESPAPMTFPASSSRR